MTFRIIDKTTGKEPTNDVLIAIARVGGLILEDIDQFFLGEDGALVLADDCGNMCYVDTDRFVVQVKEDKE